MKVSLLAQVLVVVLCLIGSEVSAQSTPSLSPSAGYNYLPVTGLTDTCPSSQYQVCLTYTIPANNPSYTSFLITLLPSGSSTPINVTTTGSSIVLGSNNGLTAGRTYNIAVYGVVNNVHGPSSQPLSVNIPALNGQGNNTNRIYNAVCQVLNNNYTCNWSSGKKSFQKVRLLIRCSNTNFYNFRNAFFVSTQSNSVTTLSAQVPILPQGTGTTLCTAILRSIYPQTLYRNTRYRYSFSLVY